MRKTEWQQNNPIPKLWEWTASSCIIFLPFSSLTPWHSDFLPMCRNLRFTNANFCLCFSFFFFGGINSICNIVNKCIANFLQFLETLIGFQI